MSAAPVPCLLHLCTAIIMKVQRGVQKSRLVPCRELPITPTRFCARCYHQLSVLRVDKGVIVDLLPKRFLLLPCGLLRVIHLCILRFGGTPVDH